MVPVRIDQSLWTLQYCYLLPDRKSKRHLSHIEMKILFFGPSEQIHNQFLFNINYDVLSNITIISVVNSERSSTESLFVSYLPSNSLSNIDFAAISMCPLFKYMLEVCKQQFLPMLAHANVTTYPMDLLITFESRKKRVHLIHCSETCKAS